MRLFSLTQSGLAARERHARKAAVAPTLRHIAAQALHSSSRPCLSFGPAQEKHVAFNISNGLKSASRL